MKREASIVFLSKANSNILDFPDHIVRGKVLNYTLLHKRSHREIETP